MSKELFLKKIHHVIQNAEQFQEEQFRMILEGLIKKGGKEAEFLLVKYINTKDLPADTRKNLIRSCGYIQNVMYLLPMKKIIDSEPNIHLKKAAILALSKYDDERALNILNAALQSISNPILLKTINEKINLIRQHHPVLALTPRFLRGEKDLKAHLVALGILKKILSPDEAKSFSKHFDSEDPKVRKGVYEILCYRGDESNQTIIFKHIKESFDNCQCINEPKCDELFIMSSGMRDYVKRFPALVEAQIPLLQSLYNVVIDTRIKKAILGIFCRCQSTEILTFIKEIYENDLSMQECILEETSGNPHAVDFLFEQYNTGKALKEKVTRSLLSSQKGFSYFVRHFFTFEEDDQAMIIRNLPPSDKPELIKLIGTILDSPNINLKKYLLTAIRNSYLFNFKSVLFDPEKDEEFFTNEAEYLDAICTVFPISAMKKIFMRIATGNADLMAIRRYLTLIRDTAQKDTFINFRGELEAKALMQVVKQVVNLNNQELTDMFLSSLADLKTLSIETYKHFGEAINLVIKLKTEAKNLTDEDKIGIRKARENLKDIFVEIKKVENIEKEVRLIVMKSIPDLMHLKRVIESNGLALPFKSKNLIALILDYFKNVDDKNIAKWKAFFKGFPILTRLFRDARLESGQTTPNANDSKKSVYDTLKVVINFEDKSLKALFKDQFQVLCPTVNTVFDHSQLEQTDILLCDTKTFKSFIHRKLLNTKRLFVVMESREEYNDIKAYLPKTFVRPVSVFKIMKQLLHDLYLMQPE
ncbi:MAG: HEAT repeat domain-containing protein [bacterium]|nr:HEAT repeat domain-containing protein [bacterium]